MQALANKAVDAGAGRSAEDGRKNELKYFATHAPPIAGDEPYLTSAGAPVAGDVRIRTVRSVGLRTAAGAMRGEASGVAIEMTWQGALSVAATMAAHKMMSPYAVSAKLRAPRCEGAAAAPRRPGCCDATSTRPGDDRRNDLSSCSGAQADGSQGVL